MRKRLARVLSAGVVVTALAIATLEWRTATLEAAMPTGIQRVAEARPERAPRVAPRVRSIDSSIESFERQRSRFSRIAR